MTLKDIEEIYKNIYATQTQPRRMVVYTGEAGMQLFNLAIYLGSEMKALDGLKYWYTFPKRVKNHYAYMSLFNRHSLFKVKIYPEYSGPFRFHFYYGTTLLFKSDHLRDYKQMINIKRKEYENTIQEFKRKGGPTILPMHQ